MKFGRSSYRLVIWTTLVFLGTISTVEALNVDTSTTSSVLRAPQTKPIPKEVDTLGAYKYSFPIDVPPGLNGLTPSISLDYDSSGGNGILGVGFSLAGFPTIERDLSYPVNYDANDRFLYKGQRLIYSAADGLFHTERDNFERIQLVSGANPSNPNSTTSYWKVTTKDGTQYTYGSTPGSRIDAVGKGGLPRLWVLNGIVDTVGNSCFINIYENTNTGEFYPSSVSYGTTMSYMSGYGVSFIYEDRSDITTTFQPTLSTLSKRLKEIVVTIGAPYKTPILVRKYTLTYEYGPDSGRSRLAKITPFGNDGTSSLPATSFSWQDGNVQLGATGNEVQADTDANYFRMVEINGDGIPDFVTYKKGYNNGMGTNVPSEIGVALSSGSGGFDPMHYTSIGGWRSGFYDAKNVSFADINSDGKADLVGIYNGPASGSSDGICITTEVLIGAGDGTFSSPYLAGSFSKTFRSGPTWGTPTSRFADINGDGRLDWVITCALTDGTNCYVVLGKNNGVFGDYYDYGNNYGDYTTTLPVAVSPTQEGMLDFNQDGLADFYSVSNNALKISISINGYFQTPTAISTSSSPVYFKDVNGDRLLDVIVVSDNRGPIVSTLCRGDGTFANPIIQSNPGGNLLGFADLNGDGYVDLATERGTRDVALGTGSGAFGVFRTFGYADSTSPVFADINRDGKEDVVSFTNNYTAKGYVTQGGTPDILKRVGLKTPDGSGWISFAEVTYSTASAVASAVLAGPQADFVPRNLVTSIAYHDGLSDTPVTKTYQYFDGRRNSGMLADRFSLGFAKFTENDVVSGRKTETFFNQDIRKRGFVSSSYVRDRNNQIYAGTIYTYQESSIGGISSVLLAQKNDIPYDGTTTSVSAFTRQKVTKYGWDSYGNCVRSEMNGWANAAGSDSNPMDDIRETTEWHTDPRNWIMKPISVKKWSYQEDATAMSVERERKHFYDGATSVYSILVKGLLTKLDDSGIVTTYGYDNWGNVTWTKDGRANAGDYVGYTTQFEYDGDFRKVLIKSTNNLGHTTTNSYDGYLQLTGTTDPNGAITTMNYDCFGRLNNIRRNGDVFDTVVMSYNDTFFPFGVETDQYPSYGASPIKSATILDGFGRLVGSFTSTGSTSKPWQRTEYIYDSMGLVRNTFLPVQVDSLSLRPRSDPYYYYNLNIRTTYDPLGRVVEKKTEGSSSAPSSRRWLFNAQHLAGASTFFFDENGHVKITQDLPGRVQKEILTTGVWNLSSDQSSILAAAYLTTKTADYSGLTLIEDSGGKVTRMEMDALGRRTRLVSPDAGTWLYSYDANSNLKTRTDAKNQLVSYGYDSINRRTFIDYPNGTSDVSYTYDQIASGEGRKGRLSAVSFGSGGDSFVYDIRGRNTHKTRTLEGIARSEAFTYDGLDRPVTTTFPDGETLTNGYSADGNQVTLASSQQNYVSAVAYNELNNVTSMTYGNGLTTQKSYHYFYNSITKGSDGLSFRLATTKVPGVLSWEYHYDNVGNVATRKNTLDSTYDETYTYDELNRLTNASSVKLGTLNFGYDALDNFTKKESYSAYYYDDPLHPHGPTRLYSGSTVNYSYDANGSMTNMDTRTATYDAENRMTSCTDATGSYSYSYDSELQRTIRKVGTKTAYFFFENYEEEWIGGVPSTTTKYYSINGQRIAQNVNSVLSFIHSDHLGSSSILTNSSGTVTRDVHYKPYGADYNISGATSTSHMFTDQIKEPFGGLYYYNARYYLSGSGRFASVDPALYNPLFGAALSSREIANPYLYCLNNPLRFTDPTGLYQIVATDHAVLGKSYSLIPVEANLGTALTKTWINLVGTIIPGTDLLGKTNSIKDALFSNDLAKMSTLFDSTESGWGETGAGVALDILGIATKGVAKDLFGLLGMAKTAKSVWDEKSAFEQDSVINEFLYKDDLFTNGDLFSGVKSDEAAVTRGNWLVDMIKSWVNGGSQTPREDLVKDLNAQIEDQNKNN